MATPRLLTTALGLIALIAPASANGAIFNYYIGRDGLVSFSSGTYAGYVNPNYTRVTFLYAHPNQVNPSGNHYHAIGAYSLTGPAELPVVNSTNANNRIPEQYTGQPPLTLVPGTGVFTGKLVSAATAEHYSDLRILSVDALAGFPPGTPEHFMFNSSGGRWAGSMAGTTVALQLVSKTAGLHISTSNGTEILASPGDVFPLGAGDAIDFTPVFWTDGSAALGTYSAELRLLETSSAVLDGGRFFIDFAVVPEPASLGLIGLAACVLLRRRSRIVGKS